MNNYWDALHRQFEAHADPLKAPFMARYMKNHFAFYGIGAVPRKELTKAHIKTHGLPEISQLKPCMRAAWKYNREMQYSAIDILTRMKKKLSEKHIPLLEELITTKSWWDTVDGIAPHALGAILSGKPELSKQKVTEWVESDNIWLQRSALLFQLKYKSTLDVELLNYAVDSLSKSPEFFVRKAMGWVLREYAKTDSAWVKEFVDNRPQLSNLTKREALRNL